MHSTTSAVESVCWRDYTARSASHDVIKLTMSVGWAASHCSICAPMRMRAAGMHMNIVMNRDNQFIEVRGTAERQAFDRAMLDRLLHLAAGGIVERQPPHGLRAVRASISLPE